MPIHYYILMFIGIGTVFYVLTTDDGQQKLPPISNALVFPLLIYVIYVVAYYPIPVYSDKYMYRFKFETITATDLTVAKDLGWAYYTYIIKNVFNNSQVYFSLTAMIYLTGYYIFARKFISSSYRFIFIFAAVMSFGFFAYGVNTLRAGFAMSLLLIAFSQYKKYSLFLLFGVMAVLIHKSTALPLVAFFITVFYNKPKLFFLFWCLCLVVSFANISSIQGFLLSNLGSFDERGSAYFDLNTKTHYKTGFRLDFVIYSLIPILVGLYYIFKLKVQDVFYTRLFSTYVFSNAIWLLVIRMNFTDRFAYLSWFLIPFLLLYPLIKYKLPINQRYFVSIILLGIMSFTILMLLI